MVFEYIQTWLVRGGHDAVHDALLRKWILGIGENRYLREVRFHSPLGMSSTAMVLVPWVPLSTPKKKSIADQRSMSLAV